KISLILYGACKAWQRVNGAGARASPDNTHPLQAAVDGTDFSCLLGQAPKIDVKRPRAIKRPQGAQPVADPCKHSGKIIGTSQSAAGPKLGWRAKPHLDASNLGARRKAHLDKRGLVSMCQTR